MLTSLLYPYLLDSNTCTFVIYNAEQVRLVKQIKDQTKVNIQLMSPENAAAYMGVRWWLALMAIATENLGCSLRHFLDCGDNGGLAMAALRMGQKKIIFDPNSPQFKTIVIRANSVKGSVISTKPKALDLRYRKIQEQLSHLLDDKTNVQKAEIAIP